MKKLLTFAAASVALALGATAAHAETHQQRTESRLERAETRLAEILEGYEVGETQSCITTFRSNDLEIIPYLGLVYDAGDTIYVARAVRPERLRDTDVPIIERHGSQLCRTDVIRTMDRYSQFVTGALFLEDFVAYNKVDRG